MPSNRVRLLSTVSGRMLLLTAIGGGRLKRKRGGRIEGFTDGQLVVR
jgi:hypothetical protein